MILARIYFPHHAKNEYRVAHLAVVPRVGEMIALGDGEEAIRDLYEVSTVTHRLYDASLNDPASTMPLGAHEITITLQ